jgi:hypothetical protein
MKQQYCQCKQHTSKINNIVRNVRCNRELPMLPTYVGCAAEAAPLQRAEHLVSTLCCQPASSSTTPAACRGGPATQLQAHAAADHRDCILMLCAACFALQEPVLPPAAGGASCSSSHTKLEPKGAGQAAAADDLGGRQVRRVLTVVTDTCLPGLFAELQV